MATQYAQQAYLNGNGFNGAAAKPDELLYEKLLALKDQVLAGRHPRLKLTPAQVAVLRARGESAVTPSTQRNARPDHPSLGDTYRNPQDSSLVDLAHVTSSSPHPLPTPNPQHRLRLAPSSVINPILLEKSPILLQAEEDLRRQREQLVAHRESQRQIDPESQRQNEYAIKRHNLEKILSQQVDTVRNDLGVPWNGFDLEKVQRDVAPVSGFASPTPPAPSPSNVSFDENSYYSSKANSWSNEHSEPLDGQNDPDAMLVSDDEDLYEPPPQVSAPSGPSPATVPSQHLTLVPSLHEQSSQQEWEPQWDDDEDEEEDYEPPAPYAFNDNAQSSNFMPAPQQSSFSNPHYLSHLPRTTNNARSHHGGPTIIENRIRSPVSIVVNHIESPAAPQPSRISPLALGNAVQPGPPPFNGQRRPASGRRDEQNTTTGMERNGAKHSRRSSPTIAPSMILKCLIQLYCEANVIRSSGSTPKAKRREGCRRSGEETQTRRKP
jgi:hypothetical protein